MKGKKLLWITATVLALFTSGCKSLNRTQKGAAIGTAGGGAIGAVIGRAAGNTALGAIIGATVGGVTGAVIGKKMDKQAEEIEREVAGVKVERVGEGIVLEFNSKILFGFDRADLSVTAKKIWMTWPEYLTSIKIQIWKSRAIQITRDKIPIIICCLRKEPLK